MAHPGKGACKLTWKQTNSEMIEPNIVREHAKCIVVDRHSPLSDRWLVCRIPLVMSFVIVTSRCSLPNVSARKCSMIPSSLGVVVLA